MRLVFCLSLFAFLVRSQISTTCGPNNGIAVTETETDSPVIIIEWMGQDNKIVFARTASLKLYRSSDEGASWQEQTTAFFGGNKFYYISPTANSSKIYFVAGFGPNYRVWTTEDSGNSYTERTQWENFQNGYSFIYILPHPKEQDIAVGFGPNKKCTTNSPDCSFDLYLTTNFGSSWQLVDTYVQQFGWGLEYTDGKMILLYSTFLTKSGRQQNKVSDTAVLTSVDIRFLDKRNVLYRDVSALFKSPENESILFLAERNENGGMNLFVSENDGEDWIQTRFPSTLEENSYTVLDDTDGAVFINVQHGLSTESGNIYVSDSYGTNFALSLKKNKRGNSQQPFWGAADFSRVEGLEGVYVANIFEEVSSPLDPPNEIKTMITFDMGGAWQRLTPPQFDSQNQPISCPSPNDCFLNLNGLFENSYGRFYSVPNSVGLMLATGNVGKYLTKFSDQVNTYLSRDAGWTWEEIAKGSRTYEIADHGSLIVLADNTRATSSFNYTWNEGKTFEVCTFTTRGDVEVENIVVEPTFTKEKFIMYGTRGGHGILYGIDFTGLHQTECKYPERAGQPDSDYELWSPSDVGFNDVEKECILGSHTTYTRKKRDARCFNPEKYEAITSTTPCPCIREDYACDFCFELASDGSCTLACSSYDPSTPPADCKEYFYASQGYRLVPGNKCQGGLDKRPIKTNCTSTPHEHGKSKGLPTAAIFALLLVVFLSIGIAVVGGMCLVVRFKKPEILYDKLKNIPILRPSTGRGRSDYKKVGFSLMEDESPFLED